MIPARVWVRLAADTICNRRRSFSEDAVKIAASANPPVCFLNQQYIPTRGPGLITCNHYTSPGFFSAWIAVVISAAVHQAGATCEVCWVMTDAWTFSGRRLGKLYRGISHVILSRIARTYGFISMPPMPPAPEEVAKRASAVQRLMVHVRSHPTALIGLAPEGADHAGGILSLPPPGVGRLALELSRRGFMITPAGIYEDHNRLVVQFGPPYRLALPSAVERHEADWLARRALMRAIAGCLPASLAGDFASEGD